MTQLIDETQVLLTPLGSCLSQSHHDWIWFYAMQEDVIYQKVDSQWVSFYRARSAT